MGMFDKVKSKMSGMGDDARARYHELKSREEGGSLDEKGKAELYKLKARFEK